MPEAPDVNQQTSLPLDQAPAAVVADDVKVEAAPVNTPETKAEAAPAAETTAEDATADPGEKPATDEQPAKPGKSRYERRLDKAYKAKADAEARATYFESQLKAATPAAPDLGAPTQEAYNFDAEAYADAKVKYALAKAEKESESKRVQQANAIAQRKLMESWAEKVDKAYKKYDDFDETVGDMVPNTPISHAIMQAENGPDIAHYLFKNPKEIDRIMSFNEVGQVREIGRLEAKLLAQPVTPKTPSKAPAPISPVNGKGGSVNDLPQDSDDINTWMKKENARAKRASMN